MSRKSKIDAVKKVEIVEQYRTENLAKKALQKCAV